MLTTTKRRFTLLTGAFALLAVAALLLSGSLLHLGGTAQAHHRPGHGGGPGGGDGGGGGGDENGNGGLINPAFVHWIHSEPEIYLLASDGSSERLTDPTGGAGDMHPSWSPDGEWIAFLREQSQGGSIWWDLYRIRPDGSELTFVRTFEGDDPRPPTGEDMSMAWTPDGTMRAVFIEWRSTQDGIQNNLWMVDLLDGSLLHLFDFEEIGLSVRSPSFSPDFGSDPDFLYEGFLAFDGGDPDISGTGIWTMEIGFHENGEVFTGEPEELTHTPDLWQRHPVWSPDGEWIAFVEGLVDGTPWSLMVIDLMHPDLAITEVTVADAAPPTWSPDGRYIGFRKKTRDARNPKQRRFDIFRVRPDGSDLVNVSENTKHGGTGPRWDPAWINDIDP